MAKGEVANASRNAGEGERRETWPLDALLSLQAELGKPLFCKATVANNYIIIHIYMFSQLFVAIKFH